MTPHHASPDDQLPDCPEGTPEHLNDYIVRELTTNIRLVRADVAKLTKLSQETYDALFVSKKDSPPSVLETLRKHEYWIREFRRIKRWVIAAAGSALLAAGSIAFTWAKSEWQRIQQVTHEVHQQQQDRK